MSDSTTSIENIQSIIATMKREMEGQAGSLETNRKVFDERGSAAPLPDGISIEAVEINTCVTAEWLIPSSPSERIVLYFHGGGYSVGSAVSHRPLCSQIARASQCKVLSVNYRLAPEYPFPHALEDAIASYGWLQTQGYTPQQIVIAGDSAGGGLTMATLLKLRQDNQAMPAGAIGISAWLDLECSSDSYVRNGEIDQLASREGLSFVGRAYAKQHINQNPLVSPFYATDLTGLSPLLLQVGDAETLLDEVVAFAGQAKQDGVNTSLEVWPNMVHVWHSLFGVIPEAEQAINSIAKWINTLE